MRKLALAPTELAVETFEAGPAERRAATVAAHEATVTCIPRCGTVAADETCFNGCTYDDCGAVFQLGARR